jgi:hypothetical protein
MRMGFSWCKNGCICGWVQLVQKWLQQEAKTVSLISRFKQEVAQIDSVGQKLQAGVARMLARQV